MGSGRGIERESIGIWNYWVCGDNSCIDKSQVLDQGDRSHLDMETGRIGVLIGRVSWVQDALM